MNSDPPFLRCLPWPLIVLVSSYSEPLYRSVPAAPAISPRMQIRKLRLMPKSTTQEQQEAWSLHEAATTMGQGLLQPGFSRTKWVREACVGWCFQRYELEENRREDVRKPEGTFRDKLMSTAGICRKRLGQLLCRPWGGT